MQGWISVHRQIREHWLWEEKPFNKIQAWLDMLMMANYKDQKILLGSKLVNMKAGSFVTSESKLAERWGWSRHKVHDFLELLQSDNMINKTSDGLKTIIFVDKYAEYQDTCRDVLDRSGTGEGQVRDTENKDNKYNKELTYSLSCDRAVILWAKLMSEKIYVPLQNVREALQEHSEEEVLKMFEEVEN